MVLYGPYPTMNSKYLSIYANRLLGIDIRSHTRWSKCKCPFHDDSTPSAGVDLSTGIFNCMTCHISLSPVQFLSRVDNIPYSVAAGLVESLTAQDGDDHVFKDYSKKLRLAAPEIVDVYNESLKLINPDLPVVKEYLTRKQLSYETLVKCKVGYVRDLDTPWNKNSIVCAYTIGGLVYGLKYRDGNGEKTCNTGCSFIPWGIDDIPEDASTIILVEGDTDRLTALEIFEDYPVISTPSAIFKPEWTRYLIGIPNVIAIPQSDTAAAKFVSSIKESISNAHIIELPWKRGQYFGKDLTEWRTQNDPDVLRKLVDNTADGPLYTVGLSLDTAEDAVVLSNLVNEGDLVIIGGGPKIGKTWLIFAFIRAFLTSEPFLGLSEVVRNKETNKILVIEEEGSKKDLYSRIQTCLGDIDHSNVLWMHRKGVKLDSPIWINKLAEIIEKENIDRLFLDPFSRLHTKNEDRAEEQGPIWDALRSLQVQFPKLVIIAVHHLTKKGSITDGLMALRGSGRMAAELDLAFICTKRGEDMNILLEGRTLEGFDGRYLVTNRTGIIKVKNDLSNPSSKIDYDGFIAMMSVAVEEKFTTMKKHCNCSDQTLRNWITKSNGIVTLTGAANGRPAMLKYKANS